MVLFGVIYVLPKKSRYLQAGAYSYLNKIIMRKIPKYFLILTLTYLNVKNTKVFLF